MKKSSAIPIKVIVYIGLFVALDIALTRPFRLMGLPFNFGFVSIATCGAVLGPVFAMLTAFISDLIGVFMFSQGAYFPGYGATAMLRALMYGLLFYKSKDIFAQSYSFKAFAKIFIGCFLAILCNTLTLPIWKTLINTKANSVAEYSAKYIAFLLPTIPNAVMFLAIQIIVLHILFKLLKKPITKMWQIL